MKNPFHKYFSRCILNISWLEMEGVGSTHNVRDSNSKTSQNTESREHSLLTESDLEEQTSTHSPNHTAVTCATISLLAFAADMKSLGCSGPSSNKWTQHELWLKIKRSKLGSSPSYHWFCHHIAAKFACSIFSSQRIRIIKNMGEMNSKN